MGSQSVTKSETKLQIYSEACALDKLAIPKIEEFGITRAYQIAFAQIDAKEERI